MGPNKINQTSVSWKLWPVGANNPRTYIQKVLLYIIEKMSKIVLLPKRGKVNLSNVLDMALSITSWWRTLDLDLLLLSLQSQRFKCWRSVSLTEWQDLTRQFFHFKFEKQETYRVVHNPAILIPLVEKTVIPLLLR